MKEDIWDAIFTLKLMEKKIKRTVNRVKSEERNTYRKIVDSILNNDRESARNYARQYLKIRRKRRLLESYLSKLSLTRLDLETAAVAKSFHDAMRTMVKAILKMRKSVDEIDFVTETEKARDMLEEIGLAIEHGLDDKVSIDEEEKIDELLSKIETVAAEELRKEIPEIPDETIGEEVKEIEEEKGE